MRLVDDFTPLPQTCVPVSLTIKAKRFNQSRHAVTLARNNPRRFRPQSKPPRARLSCAHVGRVDAVLICTGRTAEKAGQEWRSATLPRTGLQATRISCANQYGVPYRAMRLQLQGSRNNIGFEHYPICRSVLAQPSHKRCRMH